tara:strand:- start:1385 stop:1675 length:291 start_codon:yes stop_codon:yes gene_type:complete
MSNVTIGFAGGADAAGVIQAAKKFYGFDISPGFAVLSVMCAQVLGFGIAGLCRQFLVEPANIIWPGVLGNCALLTVCTPAPMSSLTAGRYPGSGFL